TTCPKCGAFRLPHHMCKSCMTYNGIVLGKPADEAAAAK
ncbi:MAG: 50S ribosomal protein L32, partial [Pseudoflavonifractor sp.]